ncbi:MAG: SAM-dependent methyltransferase [Paracoccaceae bacterium]|nr:MAG: SAM-dependent methyltransferase [Paracoccaceae bacterium]
MREAKLGRDRHVGLFLRQMMRRPGRVVALAPSSAHLARAMVAGLGPGTGSVIELGSGTGVITRAIIARGIPEERIAMFEIDDAFADLLARQFPRARLCRVSAERCEEAPLEDVGATVSGLPLLSMPTEVQRRIVGGAFRKMRPGGVFIQFTYGYRPPIDRPVREELGLVWSRSPKIWRNLPPARVYTFRQAG